MASSTLIGKPMTLDHIFLQTSNVLKVMEGYFGQSLETKMKDDRNSVLHGYKPVGVFSRVTETSKDCYETLKVSPIEMVEKSTNLPRVIQENVRVVTAISPSRSTSHRRYYRLVRPETARQPQYGQNKHTDIGSLTLLFSNQWGLQAVTPEPRPGHTIINVGDSLRFLSGKRLMSCLHHVMPFKPTEHRYSIACFLRPEGAVELKDTEDSKVMAEWFDTKCHVCSTARSSSREPDVDWWDGTNVGNRWSLASRKSR
ncbi:hypothetical protein JB92DRAFT_2838494 [Gautieria morchelliformis]|nr:hypothetical protein JB92DRAFT_2838494 [Gautieria morchelliformis]